MRAIVCGGRNFADWAWLFEALDGFPLTEVIHGGAQGADQLAHAWATSSERRVKVRVYRAEWERRGRAAGPERNVCMLEIERPDAVIAFPGGRGTADMVQRAIAVGVPVYDLSAAGWRG